MKQLERPWKRRLKVKLDRSLIDQKISPREYRIILGDLVSANSTREFDELVYISNNVGLLENESIRNLGYFIGWKLRKVKILICA